MMSKRNFSRLVISGFAVITSVSAMAAGPKVQVTEPTTTKAAASRLIAIRGGDIIIKVDDYQAARESVLKTAFKYDAQLRDADTIVNDLGRKSGQLKLRVDAANLNDLTNEIRLVGKLYSEKLQSTDQTGYYEQLQRRIALLKQSESELTSFLHAPRKMRGSDILFVQSRLYQTRAEASDAAQERVDLERGAQHGSLNVTLFEPDAGPSFSWQNWHAYAVGKTKTAFMLSLRRLMMAAYYAFYYSPFWVPIVIVAALVIRFIRRRFLRWWDRRMQAKLAAATESPTTQ